MQNKILPFKEACIRGIKKDIEFYIDNAVVNYRHLGKYLCRGGNLDLFETYFITKLENNNLEVFVKNYMFIKNPLKYFNAFKKIIKMFDALTVGKISFAEKFSHKWTFLKNPNSYKNIINGDSNPKTLFKNTDHLSEDNSVFILKYGNIKLIKNVAGMLCKSKKTIKYAIKRDNAEIYHLMKLELMCFRRFIAQYLVIYDSKNIRQTTKLSTKYSDFASYAAIGQLNYYMEVVIPGYQPTFNDVLDAISFDSREYFQYFLSIFEDIEIKNAILTISCRKYNKVMIDYAISIGANSCEHCGLTMLHKEKLVYHFIVN